MQEQRYALIITCSEYADLKLSQLPSAAQDAVDLERVLSRRDIGDFRVRALANKSNYEVLSAIEDFVSDREPNDLLLLHFSGHGLKDKDGRLYFAAHNTRTDRLVTSAVPATTVNDLLAGSRSRRKVLVLDCCYGGAFLRGIIPRSDRKVGVLERFQAGRGLVVITSSDALQYAYEGEMVKGRSSSSVFTGIFVSGIESGKADTDGDGLIGVSELYQYTYNRILDERPEQKPELTNLRVQGEIFIAKTRNVAAHISLTYEQAQIGGTRSVKVGEREEIITIPPSVTDGYEERYEGKGRPGEGNNPPGDLIVTYQVASRQIGSGRLFRRIAVVTGFIGLIVLALLVFNNLKQKRIQETTINLDKETFVPVQPDPNVRAKYGVLKTFDDFIYSIAFSPDARNLVFCEGFNVWYFDIQNGEGKTLGSSAGTPAAVAYSPDGTNVASTNGGGRLLLWDVKIDQSRTSQPITENPLILALVFSPDGKQIVWGGKDQTIRIWDLKANEIKVLAKVDDDVQSLSFSPDGKTLAWCGGRAIRLLNIHTGEGHVLGTSHGYVDVCSFSPNGKSILSDHNGDTLQVWDVQTGEWRVLSEHKRAVHSLAFSPDGNSIVTGGRDGTVRLWDFQTGKDRIVGQSPGSIVYAVAFSPDGKTIAAGGQDKTIRLWRAQ